MAPVDVVMPSIQGEAMELFSRAPAPTTSGPLASHRASLHDTNNTANGNNNLLSARPSTSGDGRRLENGKTRGKYELLLEAPPIDEVGTGSASGGRPPTSRRLSNGDGKTRGDSSVEDTTDPNLTKSKLLGGFLRRRLLENMTSSDPAKELVKRSFRHLHRGQGHVLTLDEFKEGLSNTFGALVPLELIHATFDIFDTEPKTWQLDFDEFCNWLSTGDRTLNSHGISDGPKASSSETSLAAEPPKARKPRSNDTSGEFQSSVKDSNGAGMSLEQMDRAKLKAHLMKHRSKLHKTAGLSEAQQSIVSHILVDKIKARKKDQADPASTSSSFAGLEEFKAFSRGNDVLSWPAFKREIAVLLPHLKAESDVKDAFVRMDHNGDGVVDFTDFLMWQERMREGRAKTDFWALQEEEHLEQIKLARSKASNLLVPEDYDGSTYHANLTREQAKAAKKRLDSTSSEHGNDESNAFGKKKLDQILRDNILSQVKGGSLEMLRAFRHFRPAAAGRRLFMDYREFRESIKQKGLGLSEEDIKKMFAHFDADGSGEIDFAEFRRFLQGGMQQTGLQMGANRHEEKTLAARNRVAALASTAVDPSLAGVEASSDQLLKAKVLRRITGGQSEVLRALRAFGSLENGQTEETMTYPNFAAATRKAGFSLSESENKKIFRMFMLSQTAGPDIDGVPQGEMSPQVFREWLLESNTSTSLDVGEVTRQNMNTSVGEAAIASEQAAEQVGLDKLHKELRRKVMECFQSDRRNLLRAFRGITRRKGSELTVEDFREALTSFGLGGDNATADRLFSLYDWRQSKTVNFQELIETITKSAMLPRRLSAAERRQRLEAERSISDEALNKIEDALRRGMWRRHLDDAEACFTALGRGGGTVLGLEGLKRAAAMAGLTGDAVSDLVLKQILSRHAGAGGGKGLKGWTLGDFVKFYKVADCHAAMALARSRSGTGSSEEAAKRAALVGEGKKARAHLVKQVRRLSNALKRADTRGSGKVSRKTFARALANEGGLGNVGEAELTRLLVRHGCSEQGGSYVNYPVFVASFTEAVRGSEPAKAVAAVAAATAAGAAMSSSVPTVPRKRKSARDGGGESDRSAINPQLALLPPRPSTAASGGGTERGTTKIFAAAERSTPKRASIPEEGEGNARGSGVLGAVNAVGPRARTADSSSRRASLAKDAAAKAALPTEQGYFKLFGSAGAGLDRQALLQGTKSAPALPNLVGQRPEMPKTTPLHRAMRKDVMRSMNELKNAFKRCENPYRRGVVSVGQFQAVCRKNGVSVDREDVEFLLKLHRHKPSIGGKYGAAPAWIQAPSSTAAAFDNAANAATADSVGLRYEEFLKTCHAASELVTAPAR